MIRRDAVDRARGWLGTPFHHQGRQNAVGVDCIGLIMGVARELQVSDYEFHGYSIQPCAKTLLAEVEKHLVRVGKLNEACILLFNIIKEPQHFAMYTGTETNTIIHAYSGAGKVIEQDFDTVWRRRLLGIYD